MALRFFSAIVLGILFSLTIGLSAQDDSSETRLIPDFTHIFDGVEGTFLLYDEHNDVFLAYNLDRAKERFAPHSTFKILNASIALETGVVPDEEYVIPYDAEQYPLTGLTGYPFDEWKQDHTMRTGMRYSVVWFYTELAMRIGQEQMQEYIDSVAYGNQDISSWMEPRPFWLGQSLEISAEEQLDFLRRFYHGELGFSDRTTAIVKDIIILDETDTYRWSGKTGRGDGFGWLVGYVEQDQNVYYYVMNVALSDDGAVDPRVNITSEVFRSLNIFP